MKKLSVNLLLICFLLSIFLSEFISTSIDHTLDGLYAVLNVLLPIIFGVLLAVFLVPIFLAVKEIRFRKIVIISFIVSNLILGTLLKISYSKQQYTTDSKSEYNKVDNFYHLASDGAIDINAEGVDVKIPYTFSSNDHLFFSRLSAKGRKILSQKPKVKLDIKDHNLTTIRIENNGSKDLIINKAVFLKHGLWKISSINNINADESVFPIIVGANDFAEITLNFTADTFEKRIKKSGWNVLLKMQLNLLQYAKLINYQPDLLSSSITVHDEFVLYSDNKPLKRLYLDGLWQYRAEGEWEPDLQKILGNLGFKTNIGFKYYDNRCDGEAIITNSDELAASYFERASDTTDVKIIQLAAYHAFESLKEDDALKFFYKGNNSPVKLFNNEAGAAQSLLPKMIADSTNFVSFSPQKAFGFVMGSSNTDRTKNYKNKIGIRVWKAINLKGEPQPNSYIIGCDFIGQARTNYDYQDNVYLVQNVKLLNYDQIKLTSTVKKNAVITRYKKIATIK